MTKDLTTGKIMPILVNFTVPLVLGNLFQLTYNAVDSIIVGHFVGKEALAGVVFSFFLTLLCVVFAVPILHLLQVDASIMEMTRQYLRIIFLGLMFTFLYNFFSSTLRALGDSASPLYFLIISAVLKLLW